MLSSALLVPILCMGVLAVVVHFMFPRKMIYVLFMTSFIQFAEYFGRFIGSVNRLWVWLPFFVTFFLFVRFLTEYLYSRSMTDSNKPYKRGALSFVLIYFILLALIGICSSVLNGLPLFTVIFGMRHFIMLGMQIVIFIFYQTPKLTVEAFARFIVLVSLFQIPVCLFQRLLVAVGGAIKFGELSDAITGSYQSYISLVFVQLLAFGICYLYWLRTDKAFIGKHPLLLMMTLVLPLLISNSRASFLFLGIMAIVLMFRVKEALIKRLPIIIGMALIVIAGVVFVFGYFQASYYNRDLAQEYSIENMTEYMMKKEEYEGKTRLGRMGSILFMYDVIRERDVNFWFGYGPGSTQSSKLMRQEGYLDHKFSNLDFIRNQTALILGEYGVLGCVLVSGFHLGLPWMVRRRDNSEDGIVIEDIAVVLMWDSLFMFIYGSVLALPAINIFAYFFAVIWVHRTYGNKDAPVLQGAAI